MNRFKGLKETISLLLCFIILVLPTVSIADSINHNQVYSLNLENQNIIMNNLVYTQDNNNIIYYFNDSGKEYMYIETRIDENNMHTKKYVLVKDEFKLFDKIMTNFNGNMIIGNSEITGQIFELNLNNINEDIKHNNDIILEDFQNNSSIMQKDIDIINDDGGYFNWIYLSSYEDRGYVEYWTPRIGAMTLAHLAGYKGSPQAAVLAYFMDLVVMFSLHNTAYAYTTVFLFKAAYGGGHRQSTYFWKNAARTQPISDNYWHERYY